MKKCLIRLLYYCFVFALCIPMVACDMQFGGLVGELLENKTNAPNVDVPEKPENNYIVEDFLPDIDVPIEPGWTPEVDTETGIDINDWFPDFTYDEIRTEAPTVDFTYEEITIEPDTVEVPDYTFDEIRTEEPTEIHTEEFTEIPIEPTPNPVIVQYEYDECDAWIDGNRIHQFYRPGKRLEWDHHAVVEDYSVDYIRVFGWVAFYSVNLGQIGYQIDSQEPVFDPTFLTQAEDGLLAYAETIRAGSTTRYNVQIPVRELSGEHVIRLLAIDEFGTAEVFLEFTLNKAPDSYAPDSYAPDPYAPPVFYVPGAMMASSMVTQGYDYSVSFNIADATVSEDGTYVTVTAGEAAGAYYVLPMINGKGYKANYIVIKYRTSTPNPFAVAFAGSGEFPNGIDDIITYNIVNDGQWQTAILDLSKVPAVVNGEINYLRWELYGWDAAYPTDLGYIAAFNSLEAIEQFETEHPYVD